MLPAISISLIFSIFQASTDEKSCQNFYLRKVEVGTKVVLDNIYFETGKAVLRPESFDALDQVFRFLENNPTMKLEISGHTDNTGSLRINQKLSRDRAKAVVDYLVDRGISEGMLVSEGYADTQPVAPNTQLKEGNRTGVWSLRYSPSRTLLFNNFFPVGKYYFCRIISVKF